MKGRSLSPLKQKYKVQISKITTKDLNFNLNDTFLSFQGEGCQKCKICYNQILGFTFQYQGNQFFNVHFVLEKLDIKTSQVLTKIGAGKLYFSIVDDYVIKERIQNCTVNQIKTDKPIFTLRITIIREKQQEEIENSRTSMKEQQESWISPITHKQQEEYNANNRLKNIKVENIETGVDKSPKKSRRQLYKVLKQVESSAQKQGALKNSPQFLMENLRFINNQEPIYSLKFFGDTEANELFSKQFDTDPTPEQISALKIRLNTSMNQILFEAITQECIFKGMKQLPPIRQNESKRLIILLQNENASKKISATIQYRMYDEQAENIKRQQKFETKKRFGPASEKNNGKFGFETNLQKFKKPPSLASPQIFRTVQNPPKARKSTNDMRNEDGKRKFDSRLPQIGRSKRSNTIQKAFNINISTPNRSLSNRYQTEKSSNFFENSKKSYRNRSYMDDESQSGIFESDNSLRSYLKKSRISKNKAIKIKTVNIKLYKSYFQNKRINMQKQALIPKSLNISSDKSRAYRSQPVYGLFTLSWTLKDCLFNYDHLKNFCCSLNYDTNQMNIGQVKISQNQIKYLISCGDNFEGYITKNDEPIGKIIMSLEDTKGEESSRLKTSVQKQTKIHYKKQDLRSPISLNKYEKQETTEDMEYMENSLVEKEAPKKRHNRSYRI